MRTCLILTAIVLASAKSPAPPPLAVKAGSLGSLASSHTLACTINGVEAADDLVNGIFYLTQAGHRCKAGGRADECAIEVSYALESINAMVNVVLKALNGCAGLLNSFPAECAAATSQVTENFFGVAATGSSIHKYCGKSEGSGDLKPIQGMAGAITFYEDDHFNHHTAHCVVDIKSLVKTAIRATLGFITVGDTCKDHTEAGRERCDRNILYVVASIAEMGEFIAGAVGHCGKPPNTEAACAGAVLGLLRDLTKLSAAGENLANQCRLTPAQRLYMESPIVIKERSDSGLLQLGLAAMLPIAAALSFVAGKKWANSHREHASALIRIDDCDDVDDLE